MLAVWVATALVVAACGGGDDTATPTSPPLPGSDASAEAPTPTSAVPPSGESAPDLPTEATGEPSSGQPASDDASGTGSAAQPRECPPADAVSAAWGKPIELDEPNATTGAIGLVFCPYQEVVAPGTTDQWGLEPIGDFFSITMTDQNVVIDDPTADRVDGLGEQGTWHAGAGELSVWTGDRGVIVSVTFPPDGVDAFALAAALAGLALEVDASGATATPADPDVVEAAAAERATGCPDAAQVGAAAGHQLVLAEGAIVEEGSGLCPYLAVGDDPYAFTVNVGFSVDEFDLVDPNYPSESISGLGDTAVWQELNHLLWVVTGDRSVTVQVWGEDLSDSDARAEALAIAETLV